MSFYSYKNANSAHCPCQLSGSEVLSGLNEKICIQVQRVYDSCLQQEQLSQQRITLQSYGLVPAAGCGYDETATQPVMPISFESCRSTTTEGTIRNLSVERLCDRPCFARVRGQIDVPIDILFTDASCREYIGRGVVTVDKDVLLSIPDESIVPYTIEAMVSAICVSGTYIGNNIFELDICVSVILKVLAKVEILVPSYGFCDVPPCEEFADSVCDESTISSYMYSKNPRISPGILSFSNDIVVVSRRLAVHRILIHQKCLCHLGKKVRRCYIISLGDIGIV
ncbi:MAG: hypothetical protein J6K32_01870 [Clostridia bacterium]|nr:hypothetical protein [Clostridia bacterium]